MVACGLVAVRGIGTAVYDVHGLVDGVQGFIGFARF